MVGLERVATRLVEPADEERLAHMWPRLSPRTVYRRFHGPVRSFPATSVHRLVAADHQEYDAIVAVVDDEIVGVVRYECDRDDPSRAEFAMVVQDDWQGVGLGGRLMDEVLTLARSRGVTTLIGALLAENRPMLRLLQRHVPGAPLRLRDGVYEVAVPLGSDPPGR